MEAKNIFLLYRFIHLKQVFLNVVLREKLMLIFLIFFTVSGIAQNIAQLGNDKVTLKEFQDYINIQKFIANKNSVEGLLEIQKSNLNTILSKYLDQKLFLINAKKVGITSKHPLVEKKYNETYLNWIGQIYTLKNVNLSNDKVTENDLKKTFNKFNQSKKKYSALSDSEKSGLYRLALLEKLQGSKNSYQKKLEKKYKVSRKKITANEIAIVEKEKIVQNDLVAILEDQLANFGLTIEEAKKNKPQEFNKVIKEAREELIFNKLIGIDMRKNSFFKKKIVQKTLNTYKKQLVVEVFVISEIIPKIRISDTELDLAFKELSQQRPQIKQLVPTEQEKILKTYIIQKNQSEILNNYLLEKKEEIIIKRNKDLLKKVT